MQTLYFSLIWTGHGNAPYIQQENDSDNLSQSCLLHAFVYKFQVNIFIYGINVKFPTVAIYNGSLSL